MQKNNNNPFVSFAAINLLVTLSTFLFVLPVLCHAAEEGVDVSSTFPRWGQTPETLLHCWADLAYQVTNYDEEKTEYIYRAQPQGRAGTVFEQMNEIGPRAKASQNLSLVSVPVEKYTTDIRRPGRSSLEKKELSTKTTTAYGKSTIFVINDNDDLEGLSKINDLEGLLREIKLTRSKSEDAPNHLLGYGGASIVVLLDINPADWSMSQWQAVKDFAATGGTLVFADPRGIMKMANTPLAEVLPLHPLELRPVSHLPVPGEWTQSRKDQPVEALYKEIDGLRQINLEKNPIQLLKGEKMPNAQITATTGGKPFFYWTNFGIGRVALCTVSPLAQNIRNDELAVAFWNHVLSRETAPPLNKNTLHNQTIKNAMGRLAGFQAPGAGVIHTVGGLYICLLIFVFLFGWRTDKKMQSWLAGGIISLLLTGAIFATAYQQSRDRPSRMISGIRLAAVSDSAMISEETVSIFSKSDIQTSVTGSDDTVRLRSIPPAPDPYSYGGRGEEGLFTVRYKKGIPAIPQLNVRALRSKRFSAFGKDALEEDIRQALDLENGEEGLQLAGEYEIPDVVDPDADAYLILKNGAIRLHKRRGKLDRLRPGKGADQLSPVRSTLYNFLAGGKLPSPSLAFVSQPSEPKTAFTLNREDFSRNQQLIQLFPVNRKSRERVYITPREIAFTPADKAAETMYWQGEWQEKSTQGGESSYDFFLFIPPSMTDITVSNMTIGLSLFNPTGNVVANFQVVPWNGRLSREEDNSSQPLEADRIEDGKYYFSESIRDHRLVDPVTGIIRIRLTVKAKEQRGSENKWRIQKVNAQLKGDR